MFLRLAEHILVLLIRVLGDLSSEAVSTFDINFDPEICEAELFRQDVLVRRVGQRVALNREV